MPKVSVIVPVYKVEAYLPQCVESILSQTYRDFELILVDDGSPDRCPEMCDEYALKDPRVTAIHKKNGGSSSARNAGIESASGDYVLFVDGDDWLSPETLSRCMEALADEAEAECVVFSYVREYPHKQLTSHIMQQSCKLKGNEAEDAVYRRLFGLVGEELRHPERLENMGSCCMKLYRADFARNGRYFDTAEVGSSEDTLFNIFALYGCCNIVYLDEPMYHYRKGGSSLSSNYRPRLQEQWFRLFEIMEDFTAEKKLGERYHQALNSRIALSIYGIGMNEISSGNSFVQQISQIGTYLKTERYRRAIPTIPLHLLPIPWRALLFFAKYRMACMVFIELKAIEFVRHNY